LAGCAGSGSPARATRSTRSGLLTRCLKRYLARNLYRLLENPPAIT
jgi:hypothetical protein